MPISDLRAGDELNDSCYNAGFSDGQNEPFSQSTYITVAMNQAARMRIMRALSMDAWQ